LKRYILFGFIFILFSFISNDEVTLLFPENWPKPKHDFKNEPLTKSKVALGRFLFYDPMLSKDSTISCASCHSPYNAFTHVDHNVSHGIQDRIGTRNAPALMNLAWHPTFMWDGAIHHIDVQALAPISHPKEMDETLENVIKKINRSPWYRAKFYEAFGDSNATGHRALKALSQFQLTLVSSNAKYDSVQQNKASFTAQETQGHMVFKKHCNACHTEPLFSSYQFASNGLPLDTFFKDLGRFTISKNPKDSFLFKIPSLRNIGYSMPYMHDGRFKSLNQVLNYYNQNNTLILHHKKMKPIRLNPTEKVDLMAFLYTLSDKNFIFNKNYDFPRGLLQK
jgi:cytochrome c peroxidase